MFKVQWVNYLYSELLSSSICFVCFRFCLLCSQSNSVRRSLRGKQHYDAIRGVQS